MGAACKQHEGGRSEYGVVDLTRAIDVFIEPGIPAWLLLLAQRLFVQLWSKPQWPPDRRTDSDRFAAEFLAGIRWGVDLEPVRWKFYAFLLEDNLSILPALPIDNDLKERVIKSAKLCLDFQLTAIKTGSFDEQAARAVGLEAQLAEVYDEEFDRDAEEEDAEVARKIASTAVWSTVRFDGPGAAVELSDWACRSGVIRWRFESVESNAFTRYADKLLDLLKETSGVAG